MNWRSLDWVMKTAGAAGVAKRLIPAALSAIVVGVAAQAMPACSSTPATASATTTNGGGTTTTTVTNNECANPSPGCACSTAGDTAPCGKVIARSGDFFQCSEGTTTCDGATWGTCDGDIKIQGHVISGGGVALQGLGKAQACGSTNPCDPFCYDTKDTPTGVDGGPGISATDAGLTIAFTGTPPNLCNEPATTSTMLAAEFAGGSSTFRHGLSSTTIACTGGAGDTCPFDNKCSATGTGTCAPYAQGTTNTACTTLPDFTLGQGCWDSGSSLAGLELQVCNRGGVAANSGSLVIDFGETAPTTTAAGCGANAFPDLMPVITAGNGGYCTVALGTSPIAAGECLSFNIYMPQSGITCDTVGGATLTTSNFLLGATSQLAAVVNPPAGTAFTPAVTPAPECDACNNYTTISASTVGSAAATCTSSLCGSSEGSGAGGTACAPSSLAGTVMDPGLNVGLSNVEVYIPTATPITLSDELANTSPTTAPLCGGVACPTCDNCMSLNTPFTLGVATDVNGHFVLPVSAGTYTVIAQIGRWRRIVQNVVVGGCGQTTIPTASISMPQCRVGGTCAAQGDIPKMAIDIASQESLECWLAKVGISTSEFAPYSPGIPQRIHLYENAGGAGENYWNGSAAVTPPSDTILWANGSSNTINDYSAVLLPCNGDPGDTSPSSAATTALQAYANAGGRVFVNHFPGEAWIGPNATGGSWNVAAVATWADGASDPSSPQTGTLLNTSSDQQSMYAWMNDWNADEGTGNVVSVTPRGIVTATGADSIALVNFSAVPAIASFWFNTPITASAGSYCGRVVYNDMHVSGNRGGTNSGGNSAGSTFPGSCVTGCPSGGTCPTGIGLTGEELALEYEMFQLSACNLGVSQPITPPPPPAPPTPLVSTTFTRTFQAGCTGGFTPKWGFFEWEASVPTGTSIAFSVATASDNGSGGPGAWGAAVPLVTTMMSSTTMYTASPSVDTTLTGAGQTSQDWLEVMMTLNPNASGTVSPVLLQWQQLFDCLP